MPPPSIVPRTLAVIVLVPALVWALFATAGRWDWWGGWVTVGALVGMGLASELYLWRRNPELLRRRAGVGEGTKRWDYLCLAGLGLGAVGTLFVGALDAGRYEWAVLPGWASTLGVILYGLNQVVVSWCMTANPHFEKTVRIQKDRDHRVVQAGPYGIVRHPGYAATILGFGVGLPLMLGSAWAFAPALLGCASLVVRTALEDAMLRAELDGYDDYARTVRFRLVPGLW